MSSHLFVEVSTHLLAVTPTRHWLEYLDLAGPLLMAPPRVVDGYLQPRDTPGVGLAWNLDAIDHYRVNGGR